MTRQLAFDLPATEAFSAAAFHRSPANAAALLAWLADWQHWPGGKMLIVVGAKLGGQDPPGTYLVHHDRGGTGGRQCIDGDRSAGLGALWCGLRGKCSFGCGQPAAGDACFIFTTLLSPRPPNADRHQRPARLARPAPIPSRMPNPAALTRLEAPDHGRRPPCWPNSFRIANTTPPPT